MKTAFQRLVVTGVATLALVALSSQLHAQSSSSGCSSGHCHSNKHFNVYPPKYVSPVHYGYGHVRYGYGFRPCGYDYRYGMAELIRAQATANVLHSQARNQNAITARIEMENSLQYLETRLERKRINRESRFGHLHARGEQVRLEKMAKAAAEAQLIEKPIVDPISGEVAWPILLRSSYFAKARRPIDQVFHQRSKTGSINPDHFLPMRDWIEMIERELKANVAYYEMEDYLAAKQFLRDLVCEARVDQEPIESAVQLASK